MCVCVCTAVVAEKLPCLSGKRPKRVFLDVSEDVVMPFCVACVAGVALCDIRCVQPECVCAAVVAEKLPCLWGEPPNRVFLEVSEDVLMLFCVAGVALCDIQCVSAGMCVCVCVRPSWQKSCRV